MSEESESYETPATKITVAGVTFTAEQVKSAVVVIDGRDIHIGEKPIDNRIGFGGP